MCLHRESALHERVTHPVHAGLVETTKKHNPCIAVLAVYSHYALCGGDEREASRLIKPRACNMQTTVMANFCPLKSVKGTISARNRHCDLRGTWLDTSTVRSYHCNS